MTEFFLRYVTHDSRASCEALGWTCVGDGSRMGSHGAWSCVMKWMGEGEPPEWAMRAHRVSIDDGSINARDASGATDE